MKRYIAYLRYVLRHKWYVLRAGIKIDVPLWRLIIHDWDKFLPDEFVAYAKTFYKPDGGSQYISGTEFEQAWNLHQKRNKHHWQFWLLTWDKGHTEVLEMPRVYVQEMLADWIGAGWASKGNPKAILDWLPQNAPNLKLHPATWTYLNALLIRHYGVEFVNQVRAAREVV